MDFTKWPEILLSSFQRVAENKETATIGVATGGVILISGVYFLTRSLRASATKPSSANLSSGYIDKKEVRKAFINYSGSYGEDAGTGIVEKNETPGLVDMFYHLVTDFYEWGWGQSFHFSLCLPGKSEEASEAANETRVAALCNLHEGMKCLDCGCGIGGPMRTIASVSGAEVIGVTINKYQVDRANDYNRRYGVDAICRAVQGSFLDLKFADGTFDAAYAIEATCHAPDIFVVYSEVFRVLKPGSIFVSYEWVTTPKFDSNNAEHVKAIDDINYGNGLPDMRTATQCIEAGKRVGFQLLMEYDLALENKVCKPWYTRLEKITSRATVFNRVIVNVLSSLRLLPQGMKQVHDMLLDSAAQGLLRAGKEEIFTPMHLLVFQKPRST